MNNKLLASFFLLFWIVFVMVSCQNDTVPKIEIVAEVEDQILTRKQLMDWMPPDLSEDQKEIVARNYIDRWIQQTILSLAAEDKGLALTDYQEWSINYLKKELLSQKYLETQMPTEIIVTDEEISKYYEEHKEQFIRDQDEYHIVQLYLENLDQAISKEIRESNSLLEVVEKNYLDKQTGYFLGKNGDIGYVPLNDLRDEIVQTARRGRTGRIYGPTKIESGYYYFQMLDKKEKGTYRQLDLVEDEIKLRLTNIKKKKLKIEVANKQEEKLTVKSYPEHIQ